MYPSPDFLPTKWDGHNHNSSSRRGRKIHERTLLKRSSAAGHGSCTRGHGRRAPSHPQSAQQQLLLGGRAPGTGPAMADARPAAPPAKELPRVAAGPATVPAAASTPATEGQQRALGGCDLGGGKKGALSATSPWSGAVRWWRRWRRFFLKQKNKGNCSNTSLLENCTHLKPTYIHLLIIFVINSNLGPSGLSAVHVGPCAQSRNPNGSHDRDLTALVFPSRRHHRRILLISQS